MFLLNLYIFLNKYNPSFVFICCFPTVLNHHLRMFLFPDVSNKKQAVSLKNIWWHSKNDDHFFKGRLFHGHRNFDLPVWPWFLLVHFLVSKSQICIDQHLVTMCSLKISWTKTFETQNQSVYQISREGPKCEVDFFGGCGNPRYGAGEMMLLVCFRSGGN